MKKLLQKIGIAFLVLFVLGVGCWVWGRQTSVHTVSINGTELTVRVADHFFAQKKGLSGYERDALQEDGMLFRFSGAKVRTFWMKDMLFDLDVLWIADGRIVAIDRNVTAPLSRMDYPHTVSSNPLNVDAVLELPAGGATAFGIVEGMAVEVL